MDIYREEIGRIVYDFRNMLNYYTNEYSLIQKQLGNTHLIRCRNNGKDTYYRAHMDNGRYIRKTITGNQKEINALARKEYLRILISSIEKNIKMLETTRDNLDDLDFDSIKSQMYKACRELPEESFFTDIPEKTGVNKESADEIFRIHRKWADEPYEKSNFMPEGKRFMTSAGFRVRSKSEQHIVEQLVNYGVPFRYEQVIHIDDLSYSADFTFRDKNMDYFYWEHAGMMEDPKYVEGHYRKMRNFEGVGIVPWKNLIITYDVDGTINIPMIKSIIENEVIPRM